jgi:hypothetical protein
VAPIPGKAAVVSEATDLHEKMWDTYVIRTSLSVNLG